MLQTCPTRSLSLPLLAGAVVVVVVFVVVAAAAAAAAAVHAVSITQPSCGLDAPSMYGRVHVVPNDQYLKVRLW